LQTEVSSHQQRYERTAERLRLAERNVKQARIDADTAEATSANLATALESLQKIVQDTKDAIANLQATQEEITQKSNYVQADAWQKQVRIACLERENDTLSKDYHKMENAQSSWKEEQTCLQQLLQEKERTIGMHQRQQQERRTLDEARQQRVQRLEDEWRQAQGLLVEATAAEAASVDMQSQLQTNMRELQEKNQDSHEQIQKSQTLARLAQESHHDSLKRAEKEGQQWQIQLEASQDQNERLRLEKVNLQKQISKLRGDLAAKNLSMKQKAETAHFKTAMSSTVSPEGSKTAPSVLDSASKKSVSVMTQSVGSKENSANLARRASNIAPGGCVLCGKPTFGIMKKCQCGSCSQVAHLSCVQRIPGHKTVGLSVSHPGTPAVRPPFILCTPTSKEAAV
jgi:myosin heavy subunit